MRWYNTCLIYLACIASIVLSPALVRAQSGAAYDLIAELRELPQHGGVVTNQHYHKQVGPHRAIRRLMLLRFRATQAICNELTTTDRQQFPRHVAALYDVLALTKDPKSIPYLEKQISEGNATELFEMWLPRWRGATDLAGASHTDLSWLESQRRWSSFFRSLLPGEKHAARRLAILYAMQGWLHDIDTLSFFESLANKPGTHGEELLIAQVYLYQHGKAYDVARLAATIATLGDSPAGRQTLRKFARELRHPVFIPMLIKTANPVSHPNEWRESHSVLQMISCREDISSQADWSAWFASRGKQPRADWVKQAVDELVTLMRADPARGKMFFQGALYHWNDPGFLPHVGNLAQFREIHNELLSWIKLSYRPYWRDDFDFAAQEIVLESGDELRPWARELLQDLGFEGAQRGIWAQYVRRRLEP